MKGFIRARQSNLNFYRKVPLYYQGTENSYMLYKPAGISLTEMRIQERRLPNKLYFRRDDKLTAIREVQASLNEKLKNDLIKKDNRTVKETILRLVAETFSQPQSGSLEGLSDMVQIIAPEIAKNSSIVKNMVMLSFKDYTTVLHSVNVMALALGYGSSVQYEKNDLVRLGLSALLHDVGKLNISSEILACPRGLTDEEFAAIKVHPKSGYTILRKCKFREPEIEQGALFHHERIDGSGYPDGLKQLPEFSQIIGIIDCYEALTNDDRPYRDALSPYKALSLVKEEVLAGKFRKKVFEQFIYSLL